jgi:hypothetical protein
LPVTLSADAGPLYGMMLPNLISVSVMPGCWAETVVDAAKVSNADKRMAGMDLLDWITLHPPRRMTDMCYCFCAQTLGHGRVTGLAFSCWTPHASGSSLTRCALSAR